jgi:hypothetical protein
LHPERPADARHDGDYDHGSRNIRANPLHGLHPRNSACIHGPMPTPQAFVALAGSASIVVDDRQFRPTLSIPRRIMRQRTPTPRKIGQPWRSRPFYFVMRRAAQ